MTETSDALSKNGQSENDMFQQTNRTVQAAERADSELKRSFTLCRVGILSSLNMLPDDFDGFDMSLTSVTPSAEGVACAVLGCTSGVTLLPAEPSVTAGNHDRWAYEVRGVMNCARNTATDFWYKCNDQHGIQGYFLSSEGMFVDNACLPENQALRRGSRTTSQHLHVTSTWSAAQNFGHCSTFVDLRRIFEHVDASDGVTRVCLSVSRAELRSLSTLNAIPVQNAPCMRLRVHLLGHHAARQPL